MYSKCYDCPKAKEYIDIGSCPNCRTTKLLMNTKTCMATCDICKETFGIPVALEGLCRDEISSNRYVITFHSTLNKHQILDLAKIIGSTGTETYHLFQNGPPIHIENIPMVTAYQIRKQFHSTDIAISFSPSIDQYHMFEDCWHI